MLSVFRGGEVEDELGKVEIGGVKVMEQLFRIDEVGNNVDGVMGEPEGCRLEDSEG